MEITLSILPIPLSLWRSHRSVRNETGSTWFPVVVSAARLGQWGRLRDLGRRRKRRIRKKHLSLGRKAGKSRESGGGGKERGTSSIVRSVEERLRCDNWGSRLWTCNQCSSLRVEGNSLEAEEDVEEGESWLCLSVKASEDSLYQNSLPVTSPFAFSKYRIVPTSYKFGNFIHC